MDDLKIRYNYNPTIGIVSTDAFDSDADIVKNVTRGKPHKIGTQLILEHDPDLIRQVVPLDLVHELLGDLFTPDKVRGSGPW
eukprot:CAMPEP_0204635558 /NCGR_PEP_ID=MMETSP0717-20131115/31588_1 /ASSEMBLY_ACC=CAM_ASM_000666 /TAXON_ID=230516 /ORGANISM="Chaetoceros curvisetus" /LENGTH=81 /DNA_ID=CAMNT_0051654315 /DNA_START=276 /DNA_END=518 /DNA_ORIENTATION=+